MRALCLLVLMPLSGCAALQYTPSLKYCNSVSYVREGREITITAHCFEAVEQMVPLPLPAPVKP